jgi:hypothetical protein
MLRAFKITCPEFSDDLIIIKASQTASKARYDTFRDCNDAGFNIGIINFKVIRAKEFDSLIKVETIKNKTLGWKDTGFTFGCLDKMGKFSKV